MSSRKGTELETESGDSSSSPLVFTKLLCDLGEVTSPSCIHFTPAKCWAWTGQSLQSLQLQDSVVVISSGDFIVLMTDYSLFVSLKLKVNPSLRPSSYTNLRPPTGEAKIFDFETPLGWREFQHWISQVLLPTEDIKRPKECRSNMWKLSWQLTYQGHKCHCKTSIWELHHLSSSPPAGGWATAPGEWEGGSQHCHSRCLCSCIAQHTTQLGHCGWT